jgi:hypothetical protein
MRLVLDALQEGKDRNQFVVADPELAELMLLGGIRAVIRFGQKPRSPDLARRIVVGLLHGYAAPAGEESAPRKAHRHTLQTQPA